MARAGRQGQVVNPGGTAHSDSRLVPRSGKSFDFSYSGHVDRQSLTRKRAAGHAHLRVPAQRNARKLRRIYGYGRARDTYIRTAIRILLHFLYQFQDASGLPDFEQVDVIPVPHFHNDFIVIRLDQ